MDHRKKIECYIDCVSPYSYYAFSYLRKNREALRALKVEVEFIPVFLGGINVGSGNTPPWKNDAKAAYSKYDRKRSQLYFGHQFNLPPFFPILSLLPQRALTFIKDRHDNVAYEEAFFECFRTMWDDSIDISTSANLSIALRKGFSPAEVQEILHNANTEVVKSKLTGITGKAVKELGAFGCPWFWVYDSKGNAEPFFGSDRFHYMWDFLDLPHQDLELKLSPRL